MLQEPPGQLSGFAEGFALDLASDLVADDVGLFSGTSHVPTAMSELFHDPVEDFSLDEGSIEKFAEFFRALLRSEGFWRGDLCILWTCFWGGLRSFFRGVRGFGLA